MGKPHRLQKQAASLLKPSQARFEQSKYTVTHNQGSTGLSSLFVSNEEEAWHVRSCSLNWKQELKARKQCKAKKGETASTLQVRAFSELVVFV